MALDIELRKVERERLLGLLYQSEITSTSLDEIVRAETSTDSVFVVDRLKGVAEHLTDLDLRLSSFMKSWSWERVTPLDRALLRLGAYELLFCKDVNAAIAISAAVELAKEYSTEDSGRFVNGVLGALKRSEETT